MPHASRVSSHARRNADRERDGFGLPTLVALVVTGMIGSGVFTTSGYALATLGSPQLVLLAWAVGGVIAVCGAIAYGSLATRLPHSGGEYLYLARAVHPGAGFVAGVTSLTAGFSGSIALAALACESYATPLLPLPAWWPRHGIATATVLVCGLAHATGGRLAVRLATAVILVKVLALAALVAVGYRLLGERPPATPATLSAGGFAATVMWIMFSYMGFNEAVYVASEARDPRRTVPRALLLGTLATTVLYLLLNDVFLAAAPATQLAGQADIAARAAGALGGPGFERWMRAAIALSTFAAVAGMMMSGPRIYTVMAADGVFPRVFAGPRGIERSVLLQTGLALVLVHQATVLDLLGYLGVTLSLFSACTVATLWLPTPATTAATETDATPYGLGIGAMCASVVYVVATTGCTIVLALTEPRQLLGTAVTLGAALVLWPWLRRRSLGGLADEGADDEPEPAHERDDDIPRGDRLEHRAPRRARPEGPDFDSRQL
jgi:amino acid transporter